MRVRNKFHPAMEQEAVQHLGASQDPVWRERLFQFDPSLLPVQLPGTDDIVVLVQNYSRNLTATSWLLKTDGPTTDIITNEFFHDVFDPVGPDSVDQREFIFGVGAN